MTTETTMTRIQLGAMGEALAVDHLTRMGLRVLHRNWRCRYGELDIIACENARNCIGCNISGLLRDQRSARWWRPVVDSGIGALGP